MFVAAAAVHRTEFDMTSFVVHGPFYLKYENRKGGRTLVFDDFWSKGSDAEYLSEKKGCYVFAIKNKSLTPIYIGKATIEFKQKAFNDANKTKYHNGFSAYAIGTPVMYFVVHPEQKGPTNNKLIGEIEDFLIQSGAAKNPDLQNVKGTQQPRWKIKGVIRGGKGKRSRAAVAFSSLFDIRS